MHNKDYPQWGCLILCPDLLTRTLSTTVKSLRLHFRNDIKPIAIVPRKASAQQLHDMSMHAEVVHGGDTYTSFINKGLSKTTYDWNLILFSGTVVKPRFFWKYIDFLENEKDILYPIVNFKYAFYEATLNGILVHKSVLKLVGKLPEISDLEQSKLYWCCEAMGKGYSFKGLLGVNIV